MGAPCLRYAHMAVPRALLVGHESGLLLLVSADGLLQTIDVALHHSFSRLNISTNAAVQQYGIRARHVRHNLRLLVNYLLLGHQA